jgi:hypothetical protein
MDFTRRTRAFRTVNIVDDFEQLRLTIGVLKRIVFRQRLRIHRQTLRRLVAEAWREHDDEAAWPVESWRTYGLPRDEGGRDVRLGWGAPRPRPKNHIVGSGLDAA